MKKRKVGLSIAVVPGWRRVNGWFTGRFFPLDVVNCFIGFVASISLGATGGRFRTKTAYNLLIILCFSYMKFAGAVIGRSSFGIRCL
jgi:hypothetical protein